MTDLQAIVIDDSVPWQPMTRRQIGGEALRISQLVNDPFDEVWANDIYDCQVRYLDPNHARSGSLHLSIKRLDRAPLRDWRHLQAIKNEVAGWGREALELFPAESRLVDGANQYHLWVTPPGVTIEVGFRERAVGVDEQMRAELKRRGIPPGKAKQRPWQPGISTGPNYRPKG